MLKKGMNLSMILIILLILVGLIIVSSNNGNNYNGYYSYNSNINNNNNPNDHNNPNHTPNNNNNNNPYNTNTNNPYNTNTNTNTNTNNPYNTNTNNPYNNNNNLQNQENNNNNNVVTNPYPGYFKQDNKDDDDMPEIVSSTPLDDSYKNNNNNLFHGSDLSNLDKDFIFEGLKNLYRKKVLPLEIASKYAHFASPPMGPSDFEAKPMVLILGQYSVGKTSFIRSLLKQDFPGQRIGPEPTTDRFTAIMHSNEIKGMGGGRQIPGHALVMQSDRPFRALTQFGNNFLTKFEGAEVAADILKNITIVDTPGVLAGEKQRIGRDYDFSEVIKWFAERADLIIIMFDAHKLDISDELKSVLDALKPHQDKIRILLNKADSIEAQALLRVYGALMWSLGKVVGTPEVCRVYLGSFWEAPLRLEDNRVLLEREKNDLLAEMMSLPQNAVVRRINELVKRARSVKVHAYIIHYLKKQMPYVIGKSEKQKRLLDRLDREFLACARRYNLPLGDFPPVDQYRKMLSEVKDISDFKKLDKNLVYEMDKVLTHDIPMLLQKATNARNQNRNKEQHW